MFSDMVLEPLLAFFQEDQVDFLQVVSRGNQAGTVVLGIRMVRQSTAVERSGRRHGNPVAFNVGLKPISTRTACRTKKVVESTVNGCIGNRA